MRGLVLVLIWLAGMAPAETDCRVTSRCFDLSVAHRTGAAPVSWDPALAADLRSVGLWLLVAACHGGEAAACSRVGAVGPHIDSAAAVWPAGYTSGRYGCKAGFAGACSGAVTRLTDTVGMRPVRYAAPQEAKQIRGGPCRTGEDTTCPALWTGLAPPRDRDPSAAIADRLMDLCLGPVPEICRVVAGRIMRASDRTGSAMAVARLEPACDGGHARACLMLAHAVTPQAVTPQAVITQAVVHDAVTPRTVTPEPVTPQAVTPQLATHPAIIPQAITSRVAVDHAATICDTDVGEGCDGPGRVTYAMVTAGQGDRLTASGQGCDPGHGPSCHDLPRLARQ